MEFEAVNSHGEKIVFFDQYFRINVCDLTHHVERFQFPFPEERRHTAQEVEYLDKMFSMTAVDRLLNTKRHGTLFFIHPSTPLEWFSVNRYICDHKFISEDDFEKEFWSRVAIVPEQVYFIESQISKFNPFINHMRSDVIPFHKEYYRVFEGDVDFRPYLNKWFTLFICAYSLVRREDDRSIPSDSRYLYELYFLHLGYIYAHFLG